MNPVFVAAFSAAASVAYWIVAANAATRRGLTIGTLPALLPLLAAATAFAASLAGLPATAAATSAGVAVAALADARTGYIFDPLTFAILAVACMLTVIGGSVTDGVYGATAVGGALFFLYAVSRGRGLGLGDVKLGAVLGAALGLVCGLTAIALAFVFGGTYGAWLLATRRARAGTSIRFGPFMAAGTYAALLASLGWQR